MSRMAQHAEDAWYDQFDAVSCFLVERPCSVLMFGMRIGFVQ